MEGTTKRKARRRLVALALTVTAALAVLSQAGRALVVDRGVGQPDVIVMLASHEFERIPATAALARQHPSSVVLLTVPKDITEYNCQRCAVRADWLGQEGVAQTRIHTLPDRTANTRDEALAVLAYWRRTPFERLAVVTSPYHARRSLSTFETVFAGTGAAVGIYPATTTSQATPRRWWLRGYDRGYVIYEWAALAYYRLKFGVPMRPSARRDWAVMRNFVLVVGEPSNGPGASRARLVGAERGFGAPASDGDGGSGGAKPPGLVRHPMSPIAGVPE